MAGSRPILHDRHMDQRCEIKRVLTLVTATALLVLALASPALAAGAIEQVTPAHPSLTGVPLEITTNKAWLGLDAKRSGPNRTKSVIGKQPLPGHASKQLDVVDKQSVPPS